MALAKHDDGTYQPDSGFFLRSAGDGVHFELSTDRDERLLFELAPNVVPRVASKSSP